MGRENCVYCDNPWKIVGIREGKAWETPRKYFDATVSEIEYQVLKELEEQIGEPIPQVNEIDWGTFGFTTEGLHVIGVGLPHEGLTSFPESLGQLINLQRLSLFGNQLTSLPETLGQLINLQRLSLASNQLTSLPETLGQLINLQRLYLDDNQLTSLPETLGQLINLQRLYLHNNQLSFLPETLTQLTNLQKLSSDSFPSDSLSIPLQIWVSDLIYKTSHERINMTKATIDTRYGEIVIEFFDEVVNTVKNFVTLAESGFYDGLTFHRSIPNFVVQGGCPLGTGTGGPGYRISCETEKNAGKTEHKHVRGVISMAHAGKDTGGSQFFLVRKPQPHLDGKHTVFGKIVTGTEIIEKLSEGDKIKKVIIENKSPEIENHKLIKL